MRIFPVIAILSLFFSYTTAEAAPKAPADPEVERINSRIAELNPPDKGLPESDFGLLEERRAIKYEIREYQDLGERFKYSANDLDYIATSRAELAKVMSEIASCDCQNMTVERFASADKIYDIVDATVKRFGITYATGGDAVAWAGAPWDRGSLSSIAYCEEWKKFIGDATRQNELLGFLDKQAISLQTQASIQEVTIQKASELIELLQKRREIIDKRISSQETKFQLADRIWAFLGIIGLFSIGAILAVKLFPNEIQFEWVASGQVIQFVTVMILLSVILALGLAGILTENILGTLLGGIGGYVLSQGVGRAVAREVSRNQDKQV